MLTLKKLREQQPTEQKAAEKQSAADSLSFTRPDGGVNWKKVREMGGLHVKPTVPDTPTHITPRSAEESNRLAASVIKLKSSTPSYTETKAEIDRLQQVADAQRKLGNNVSVYDRAVKMLQNYLGGFNLSNAGSPAARQALYQKKQKELEKIQTTPQNRIEGNYIYEWGKKYDINSQEGYEWIRNKLKGDKHAADMVVGYLRGYGRNTYGDAPKRYLDEIQTQLDWANEAQEKHGVNPAAKSLQRELSQYERENPSDFYEMYRSDPNFEKLANQRDGSDKLEKYLNERGNETKAEQGLHGLFFARALEPLINPTYAEGYRESWHQLTDSEKEMFYYLYNKQGEDAAMEYLDKMSNVLQKRSSQEIQKEAEASEGLDLALRTASSVPEGIIGGVTGYAEDLSRMLAGENITPYSPAHQLSLGAEAVRSRNAQDIDRWTGGLNIGGYTLGDLYQAGMSAVDSVAGFYALGPAAYGMAMGMGAAQSKARDLYEKGASPEQIFLESTASGAFEMLFESVSLDVVANKIIDGMLKSKPSAINFIKSALLSSGVEASEEVFTDLANYAADIMIMGDKSERQQLVKEYIAQGYSQQEAESLATVSFLQDLAKSGASGFFSGLFGGSAFYGKGAYQAAKRSVSENVIPSIQEWRETQNYVKENADTIANTKGGQESVMLKAKEIIDDQNATDKKALQKAYDKAQKSVNTDNYAKDVARVAAETEKHQLREYEQSGSKALDSFIREKITEYAGTGADTGTLVAAARKMAVGEQLTSAENKAYRQNEEAVNKTVGELRSEEGLRSITSHAIQNAKAATDDIKKTRIKSGVDQSLSENEDIFTVSDDGKTYISGKNNPVSVQKFTKITSGDMTAQLDDGTEVKASDISWGDDVTPAALGTLLDLQKLYGVSFTPELVNSVYQAAKLEGNANGAVISAGIREAFDRGYINQKGFTSSYLSKATAQMIYDAAHKLREDNTAKKKADQVQNRTDKAKKGEIVYEKSVSKDDLKKLNNQQRLGLQLLNGLAQDRGLTVHVFKSQKVNGKYVSEYAKNGQDSPNGFYTNGEIYIDLNAGTNGQGFMLFTASHELTHYMRAWSEESFNKLADFLVEHYEHDGATFDELVDVKMSQLGCTRDVAYEEVIAGLCESFLTDAHLSDRAAELYRTDKGIANKFKRLLYKIKQRIAEWLKGVDPESSLGRCGRQMAQKYDEILDLYVKGLDVAMNNAAYSKNAASTERMEMARESEQSRDSDYLSAVERGDMETAQRMVDEAAKAAGYTIKAYHGTPNEFYVFDKERVGKGTDQYGAGFYFATDKSAAEHYGKRVIPSLLSIKKPIRINRTSDGGDLFDVSITPNQAYKIIKQHPMMMDEEESPLGDWFEDYWSEGAQDWMIRELATNYLSIGLLDSDLFRYYPNELHEAIRKVLGYDGVEVSFDNTGEKFYVAWFDNQMKSADPVTYDDNGKVIPLSERFNPDEPDIRYQDRWDDDLFADDTVEGIVAHQYATHSAEIGEVLRNTADIDIAAGTVKNIVSRVMKNNLGAIDERTKKALTTRIMVELESAKSTDPETVINNMISAVRDVVEEMNVTDDMVAEQLDELKAAFSGKYYLSDEQIKDLKEHDYTLGRLRKELFGKVNIVSKDNLKKSINGGYMGASELSLEGMSDLFTNGNFEQIFGISADEWDTYGYHAPMMLKEAFENLTASREIGLTQIADSEDMDNIAVRTAAEITGAIVQQKYNSRHNPYVSELVEKVRKQQKEKNAKRVAEFRQKERERTERLVKEVQRKNRELRDKEFTRRKRAEFRQKIRKIHDDLGKMALNPKAKKYIPTDLITQTMGVLASINMDNGFKGARADSFRERLEALGRKFRSLGDEYGGKAQFDEDVSGMLDRVIESVGNTPLGKMTVEQLKMVYDVLKAVQFNIRNRIKLVGEKSDKFIGDYAFKWMDEIDDANARKILASKYNLAMARPESFFNVVSGGAKNNVGLQVYDMLNRGQLHKLELETRFARMFEDLVNDTQAKNLKKKVDVGLVDESGKPVLITRGMMLSLYMHLLNEDNIRHIGGGGITVPSISDYYNGKLGKAWGDNRTRIKDSNTEAKAISERVRELHKKLDRNNDRNSDEYHTLSSDEVSAIWEEIRAKNQQIYDMMQEYVKPFRAKIAEIMTPYEKEWINRAQEFFDVESKNELNATTLEMYGFEKAVVDNYFPIHTDPNFVEQKFEDIVRDMNLENMGMMKSRVRSHNPILLEDITDVISRQITNVAQYCGLVIPMNNVKRIYSVKTNSKSVANSFAKFDGKAKKYFENLMSDLVGSRERSEGGVASLLRKARHGLAGSALTMNLKVAMKQAASYPTAAAELGYSSLAKALVKPDKGKWALSRADKELIYKYSPLLAYRSMGYSSQELGDLKREQGIVSKTVYNKKLRWFTGWIQAVDTATVGRLWYASQYYVDKEFSDLQKGTDEYYKKVAEVFNNVIERTQPNYTVMQRPDILRSTSDITKMFTMFMTQRLQNFNIVYDAGITLSKMKSDFKDSKNGVTIEDVQRAKKRVARAVSSQLVSAAVLVGMTIFADAFMHKMNPWRDDDDELTWESIRGKLISDYLSTLFGSVIGGSEVYEAAAAILGNGNWYGLSLNGVDTISDLISGFIDTLKSAKEGAWKKSGEALAKMARSLAQYAGIPFDNAKNIVNMFSLHAEDIANGQFLSFESGVNRTVKQNLHRAYTTMISGDKKTSKEIFASVLDSKTQEFVDKGEKRDDAETKAKTSLRTTIKAMLANNYISARKAHYQDGKKDAWNDIQSITTFLESTGIYKKPSVKETLENWWDKREEAESNPFSDFISGLGI